MKAFLEEYGLIVVSVVVIAVLLGVATIVSGSGKTQMTGTYDNFANAANEAMSNAGMSAVTEAPTTE